MKTSKEIYAQTGITRKMLRLYVQHDLIRPSAITQQGAWLFEDNVITDIQQIRKYQSMGFSIRETKQIMEHKDVDMKEALIRKISELIIRREKLDRKIANAEFELAKTGGRENEADRK